MRTSSLLVLGVCATSCAAMAPMQQLGNGVVEQFGQTLIRLADECRRQASTERSASFVRQTLGQIPAPGECALLGFATLAAARRRRSVDV